MSGGGGGGSSFTDEVSPAEHHVAERTSDSRLLLSLCSHLLTLRRLHAANKRR